MDSRRDYLQKAIKTLASSAKTCIKEQQNIRQEISSLTEVLFEPEEELMDTFFDSYETSYSLTLAYPREMFEQMAEKAGIPHEGREVNDIARDLTLKGII